MNLTQMMSKRKAALTVAAIAILLGASPVFAHALRLYTSTYDFQVLDPSEPVVAYSVGTPFIGHEIPVQVNISSHEGVKQLNGTADIILLAWNETASAYQSVETLASNAPLTLTPEPTVLNFSFTTDTAGSYRIQVNFTATAYELA